MAHLPFCFAWATASETVFGPQHEVHDEVIASFLMEHPEGDAARLTLRIRNPLQGLIAPGRKRWAWLSWEIDSVVVPIFFGQLVATPDDMFGEVVTLVFVAKSAAFLLQRQAVAQTLKKLPGFDMIFYDPGTRDDPETILNGYSMLYHVDRVTHQVSVSDVLVGEDGEEIFDDADVPYKSVKYQREKAPKKSVTVAASVPWTQSFNGEVLSVVNETIQTYTGDGIMSDWPKPMTTLQGGWSVRNSRVRDHNEVQNAQSVSYQGGYTNQQREHSNGDILSQTWNVTMPVLAGPFLECVLTYRNQIGIIDPYSIPQTNVPAETELTWLDVPLWRLTLELDLQYEARRQRGERIKFTMRADIQEVIVEDEENISGDLITLDGADVGLPLIDVLKWISVKETAVDVGTIIVVVDTDEGGIVSYQICTTAGITGSTEPDFSELVGVTTPDGTSVWTSLGTELFTDAPDWIANDLVPLGEVLQPEIPKEVSYSTLLPPHPPPIAGVDVDLGTIVRASNGTLQQCTTAGTTGLNEPDFGDTRGDTTNDGSVVWTCLGTSVGSTAYQICVSSGTTGALKPAFAETVGATTLDGTVTWKSLGPDGGFIAPPIGNGGRRSYFPTDRGIQSIEHLLSVGRAWLRMASRAVKITFDCRPERIINLSCRKNATIIDRRLPGGYARGKIISYSLSANERGSGVIIGNVVIGCAIGNDTLVVTEGGEPDYVEVDYVEVGYQYMSGATYTHHEGDIAYGKPKDGLRDDDITFPLSREQAVISQGVEGFTEAQQRAAILHAFTIEQIPVPPGASTLEQALARQRLIALKNREGVAAALRDHPMSYKLVLANLTGGPFEVAYELDVGKLSIPKMIDLEAPPL